LVESLEPLLECRDRLVDPAQTEKGLREHLVVLGELLPLVGETELLDRLRVLLSLQEVGGEVPMVEDLGLLSGASRGRSGGRRGRGGGVPADIAEGAQVRD